MRSKIFTTLAITAFMLTACSPDLIERGIVTGGEHHEQWLEMMPITTCSGNPSVCTTSYVPINHPETWTLKLDDGSRKGQRDVTEEGYRRCLIGQTWPDCEAAK